MAQVDCVFDITAPLGGDLGGPMFDDGAGNSKGLKKNENSAAIPPDDLVIKVRWLAGAPNSAPGQLTGDVVFSMSQKAKPTQNAASPFKNGSPGRQLCHQHVTVNVQNAAGANGEPPFYEFGPYPLVKGTHPGGSQQGSYELTFVAEQPGAAAGQEIQWSQDPEFDVSG
jgi:hypothetical protein